LIILFGLTLQPGAVTSAVTEAALNWKKHNARHPLSGIWDDQRRKLSIGRSPATKLAESVRACPAEGGACLTKHQAREDCP
jgi:hypothetical protein